MPRAALNPHASLRVRRSVGVVLALLAALSTAACIRDVPVAPYPDLPEPPASDLAVGPGDAFDVRVFDEAALSNTYIVAADGMINFPLIGLVAVGTLVPSEIEKELARRLSDGFVRSPQVSVLMKEYRSKTVTVTGQVRAPGTFGYVRHMSIVEAVARAGGFTALAKKNSVKVTRTAEGPRQILFVAVDDIGKGKSPDFILRPGDKILVEERPF